MAETNGKADKHLDSLRTTVGNVLSLVAQLVAATKVETPSKDENSPKDVNAIDLAHDAATLIKAHSTKISLLIINTPFTPTAIMAVLREVSSGPLPALATSVELCNSDIYTKVMHLELQWRVEKVLLEFRALIENIPLDGKVLSSERKNGTGAGMGIGSLATTGMVWAACDAVAELKGLGIGGLMIQKIQQYRDTVKDALDELQEWAEETSEDEDEEVVNEAAVPGNGLCNTAQDTIDDMFQDQRHIPANDVHKIRDRLEYTLRRLKLINLLFQAIIKRRLKTLPAMRPDPSSSTLTTRLDILMPLLSRIPDLIDELASAFYSLDDTNINTQMMECFSTASKAAGILGASWDGKEDEYFSWSEKFVKAMSEDCKPSQWQSYAPYLSNDALRQCQYCHTEFQLDVKSFGDKGVGIAITVWMDLGYCRSPLDPPWALRNDSSRNPATGGTDQDLLFEPESIRESFGDGATFVFDSNLTPERKRKMWELEIERFSSCI